MGIPLLVLVCTFNATTITASATNVDRERHRHVVDRQDCTLSGRKSAKFVSKLQQKSGFLARSRMSFLAIPVSHRGNA
jgi:hypothetical protein